MFPQVIFGKSTSIILLMLLVQKEVEMQDTALHLSRAPPLNYDSHCAPQHQSLQHSRRLRDSAELPHSALPGL